MDLRTAIRTIPNFPKDGIMFRDITTLLQNPEAFRYAVAQFVERYKTQPIDAIVGIESRGFIFGAALAHELGKPFVLARKPGKLPGQKTRVQYDLEYGSDSLEIHTDSLARGMKVIITDDLIASGGTLSACIQLVQELGATVHECACVVELPELNGRKKLGKIPVFIFVQFEGA